MSLEIDAKLWVYNQLTPTEKEAVLMRAGVQRGQAVQTAQFGGPAGFLAAIGLRVEFESDNLWHDMPVIKKFIAIARLASKLSPHDMQSVLMRLKVSDNDAVQMTGAGYTLEKFYEAVKDAPKKTWDFCPGHAKLVERIYV